MKTTEENEFFYQVGKVYEQTFEKSTYFGLKKSLINGILLKKRLLYHILVNPTCH